MSRPCTKSSVKFSSPTNGAAAALVVWVGLAIVVLDRIGHIDAFYYWLGVAMIAVGALALVDDRLA